jgi:hypothetical protein
MVFAFLRILCLYALVKLWVLRLKIFMYQRVIHKQFLAAMPLMCALSLTLASCASKSRGDWEDIDYSSVYRKANQRENDSSYVPSSGGCLDADFGCQ